MFNYVIRRLLLMIPTFLGATLLVFIILQMAPGGPLEKTIMQIQLGGTHGGGEGGAGEVRLARLVGGGGGVGREVCVAGRFGRVGGRHRAGWLYIIHISCSSQCASTAWSRGRHPGVTCTSYLYTGASARTRSLYRRTHPRVRKMVSKRARYIARLRRVRAPLRPRDGSYMKTMVYDE